jgi:hypothetical protein
MVLMLEAERARLAGDSRRARAMYEKVSRRAQQQDWPHHAALAQERLARMLVDLRRRTEANSAFNQAIHFYRDWGAAAKALALRTEQESVVAELKGHG